MSRFGRDVNATPGARETRRAGFFRSEDGSLIVFSLFIFLVMLVVGGLAVDLMRYETHRARLQSTLDRAVLAAGSLEQTNDPEKVVLDYFERAGLGRYIDASQIDVYENEKLVTAENPGPDKNALTSRRVDASAALTMNTTLMRLTGINTLGAPAGGSAEEAYNQIEISLVLDVSGSMGSTSASGRTKISELKTAAKQFVNMLLCDPAYPNRTTPCEVDADKTSITLIPYAEQVLVGEDLLDLFNATEEHEYSSCVTFAASDFNTTSLSPTQRIQREGHIDPWSSDMKAGPDSKRTCPNNAWRSITPVTGNAADLRSAVGSLRSGGYTSIDVGMKWATTFLDPAARPVVGALADDGTISNVYKGRPADFGERGIGKVVVLMTDGVNTNQHYLYNGYHSGPSPMYRSDHDPKSKAKDSLYDEENDRYFWVFAKSYKSYPMDRPYGEGMMPVCNREEDLKRPWRWNNTSYCRWKPGPGAYQLDYADVWDKYSWKWWASWDFLRLPGNEYYQGTKNSRLNAICGAAKDQGMIVYTIGFEVTSGSRRVMKNCASGPAFYYEPQGGDISDAFKSIARSITKLRLVN